MRMPLANRSMLIINNSGNVVKDRLSSPDTLQPLNDMSQFVNLKPNHALDLFDKLIRHILNYSAEVWDLNSMIIERVHL